MTTPSIQILNIFNEKKQDLFGDVFDFSSWAGKQKTYKMTLEHPVVPESINILKRIDTYLNNIGTNLKKLLMAKAGTIWVMKLKSKNCILTHKIHIVSPFCYKKLVK